MKKILAILSFVAVCSIAVYLLLFNNIVSANNLSQMTIYYDDQPQLIMNTDETSKALDYIKLFNLAKKIDDPSLFQAEYEVSISYENKDSKHLALDFDLEHLSLLFKDEDANLYYKVSDPEIEQLFIDPTFRAIYPSSKMPQAKLSYEDMILPPSSSETTWQYQLVNGAWDKIESADMNTSGDSFSINKASKSLKIDYNIPPKSTHLKVLQGDVEVLEAEVADGTFMPYSDEGNFTYILTSYWERDDFKGEQVIHYDVNVDLPVRFRVSKTTATAGDFITIFADYANADETLFIDQNLVSWTPSFFDNQGTKMAFIPLNYWAKIGNYSINLSSDIMQDKAIDQSSFDIRIKGKNFKKQYLYIDETIEKSTRNDDAYTQYAKYFNPARENITSEKLWEGPFIAPVEGRVSTEFGEMRYVNDALTSYRHSGIDFAVAKGTPIKAPNRGHVNLAMFLTLTGNTIVIDHGMGLFSVYFHLDALNVEKGQMVDQGDIIGKVGTTGFSTGPHLHYTTSIGKVNFDPNLLDGNDPSMPQ